MSVTTIRIPDELQEDIQARIVDTEFGSVEEYVLFVLFEVVEANEYADSNRSVRGNDIEQRLEALGYV